ncbi:hypothetical protein PACTADRAFT_75848 [Pachysolen tannophilus NRRL Y-2460]|uniref:Probable quinone oxidoreductase n=1 Tax=Pachysolen tannophilus NRRL Y-2460 TaxID=669874 RepID=A0A1E4TUA9_PACTA|nr:hypothetical protein PACTADRAFT_75848 [Pachysolen tannophilus NRRL Y-2460]
MTTLFEIPKTQKVVLYRETGGPEVLRYEEDFPVPSISEDEILVKNKFAGINFIDSYFRSGLYPSALPNVLGREASGVVAAVGKNVKGFKPGDKVAYLSNNTFAQYTKYDPKSKIVKLDDGVTDEQLKLYAGSIVNGLTVLTFITEAYNVQKGDYILIHAAAGGCGLIFTQLVTERGAHVIATASTHEKLQLAKKFGAKFLINSKTDNIVEKVKEFTNGKGVIASFDGIGKDTVDISLDSLARKGTFVSFGNASGAVPPLSIMKLSSKNLKVLRPMLYGYVTEPEEWEYYSKELLRLIDNGDLKINIFKTFPLKDYATATQLLEDRKTSGKIVLEIPQ